MIQSRGRPNKVIKSTAQRRPNRKIDEDQLAAHFEGTDEDHALYRAATAAASADAVHHVEDEVIEDAGVGFKDDPYGEGDAEADPDTMDHEMSAPMAPMSAEPHHHHHHHHQQPNHGPQHHQQAMDDILGQTGMTYAAAAAAAAAADLQPAPPPPQPNVGSTMPAPQPLVAATDFQPTPAPAPPQPQPVAQPAAPSAAQSIQQSPHHAHSATPPASVAPITSQPQPQPQPQSQLQTKTTEEMAHDSGYTGFKVDSAFAKRMARDPGQRLAEQRRHGQDLNLVRRSNVEALFAQIAGSEAASPCAHCRKGQGPWTVCVVYSGQMMGSCANCWFNASGSRCSFHEKSQPITPGHHPYATVPVTVPIGSTGHHGTPSADHPGGSPAQLQSAVSAALWQAPAALFSHDSGLKQTVQSALMHVRQADRYTRALIEVDVAAKQLALKIVAAEELAAAAGDGDDGQQQGDEYGSPPAEDGGA